MQLRAGTDITGQTFGRLTAVKVVRKDNKRRHYWLCRCQCTKMKVVRADCLRDGSTVSCGCYRVEGNRATQTFRNVLSRLVPQTA